ncbi:MAG: molybdopterin-dependent oxidoreductase [Deltaproteobacteria bacterium]|nr:molybdopterin-dependent oxidoreductase [Deltaproteobacteria bacterium]
MTIQWHQGACILCSINCGIRIGTDGPRIAKVKGDREHPASQGYICEKATQLDRYQNGRDRLSSPMRRRPDGTYEAVDWDTAIAEVAAGLAAVRDEHGGESIFHYGGGAQGNHLIGAYGRATRALLGSRYTSNALAQEKTGEFWVDGQLFGKARCHTAPDFEHAEVAVFVGKNPYQSHGFHQARVHLRALSKDPARTLIVIDPRRTETAQLADVHLQVKPGGDAWLLGALVAVLLKEELVASDFIAERTVGFDDLVTELGSVDVDDWSRKAGVDSDQIRAAARTIAAAASVSVLEDLGTQQAPHSTLNSWLEKLLFLLTGNFGVRGGMNIHSRFASLGGGKGAARGTTPAGNRIVTGLVACNDIADEILGDHEGRFRAMIVESTNPVHSLADSQRMRQAMRALDFSVVIDVAMTETAREASYVLPAASQYEKWEMTFFNLEFPHNVAHLRPPVFPVREGTLPEAEIHSRLFEALGGFEGLPVDDLRAAATQGRDAYAMAFMMAVGNNPQLMKVAPALLYATMGDALPEGAEATAVVWALAQTCAMSFPDSLARAGFEGAMPIMVANALFEKMLADPAGVVFSVDDYDETWRRVETPDQRVRLVIPELLPELRTLFETEPSKDDAYPFVLAAGERRSSTANTLYRDPEWRRGRDHEGALRVSPGDAARLGLEDGAQARVTTKRGSALAVVEVSDTLRDGHASLPNGTGLSYAGAPAAGVAPNELTASEDKDWLAGTPWHKHVRARIEAL